MSSGEPGYNAVVADVNNRQASGNSIFWALTAIVFHAMYQPSVSGHFWSGNSFEGLISPHRSSPVVCLLDAITESWFMVERYRNPSRLPDQTATPAKSTDVTLRLTIFALAVLPQAIKLFAMRGILVTQILAAVFLTSSLVSMFRSKLIEAPNNGVLILVESLRGSNKARYLTFVTTFAWCLHGLGLLGVWYVISIKLEITRNQDIKNLVDWIGALTTIFLAAYILQHIMMILFNKNPHKPFFPIALVLLCTGNLGITSLFDEPDKRGPKMSRRLPQMYYWFYLSFVLSLLINTSLCSFGLAYLLDKLAKYLIARAGATEPRDDSALELGRLPSPSDEPGRASGTRHVQPVGISNDVINSSEPDDHAPLPDLTRGETMPLSIGEQRDLTGNINDIAGGSTNETCEPSLFCNVPLDNLSFAKNLRRYICLGILRAFYILNLIHFEEEDQETALRSATEQGITRPAVGAAESPKPEISVIQKVRKLVNWLCKKLIRFAYLFVLRLGIAYSDIFIDSARRIYHRLARQPNERIIVTFGIVNFATAIVYYMSHFDGLGTFTPEWATVLG